MNPFSWTSDISSVASNSSYPDPDMQRSDIEQLCSSSDEDENWSWNHQGEWRTEYAETQNFYKKWRSGPFEQPAKFPYIMGLGTNSRGDSLLQFHTEDTADSKIVITKAYEDTYNRILNLRERKTESNARGVVLTGQPGIGKTTYLKYMLVRLISARQVVLLHTGLKVTLFYAGQAYYRSATDAFLYVPRREGKNNHPVWALIDMDFLRSEPPLDGTSQVWPIQASTLNPVRWGNWSKRFNAANWGMPLWTMEELVLGVRLQIPYTAFRRNLKKVLEGLISTSDDAVVAALEVLKNVDGYEIASDEDVKMPKNDVDSAIKALVWNAVANYGFAPRVVYAAIFEPVETNQRHGRAITNLSYQVFKKLALDSPSTGASSTKIGQHLVSVSPIVR